MNQEMQILGKLSIYRRMSGIGMVKNGLNAGVEALKKPDEAEPTLGDQAQRFS
jgi:hypothetical protein